MFECMVSVSGCLCMGVRVTGCTKLTCTGQKTQGSVLLLRNFHTARIHVQCRSACRVSTFRLLLPRLVYCICTYTHTFNHTHLSSDSNDVNNLRCSKVPGVAVFVDVLPLMVFSKVLEKKERSMGGQGRDRGGRRGERGGEGRGTWKER